MRYKYRSARRRRPHSQSRVRALLRSLPVTLAPANTYFRTPDDDDHSHGAALHARHRSRRLVRFAVVVSSVYICVYFKRVFFLQFRTHATRCWIDLGPAKRKYIRSSIDHYGDDWSVLYGKTINFLRREARLKRICFGVFGKFRNTLGLSGPTAYDVPFAV